ncbi:MAG: hypothetical protein ACI9US_001958 [Gammaproteobacteria bacterium]
MELNKPHLLPVMESLKGIIEPAKLREED